MKKPPLATYDSTAHVLVLDDMQYKALTFALETYIEVYQELTQQEPYNNKTNMRLVSELRMLMNQINKGLLTTEHFANKYNWQRKKLQEKSRRENRDTVQQKCTNWSKQLKSTIKQSKKADEKRKRKK